MDKVSGNSERKELKLYVWMAEDSEEGCVCKYVSLGYSIEEAREKAIKGLHDSPCAWCLDSWYLVRDEADDIIDRDSWINYINSFTPPSYDLNEQGNFI